MRLRSNPLRLADERILVEQLRALMLGTLTTGIPITGVVVFLVWSLSNANNALILSAWAVLALLSHLNFQLFTRRCMAAGIAADQTHRTVWILMLLSVIGGVIWAGLAWIALGNVGLSGNLLVLVAIAAMASGSASSRSPVLPVFAAYIVPNLLLTALKMWQIEERDPVYVALGAACILYMFGLLGQARSNAKTIRTSIELRFENIDLLDKLRRETELAKLARTQAEQAQREAEHANAAKSKFLAAASHDLRQPIHAQGLFLDVLSRTSLDARQHQLLDSVHAAAAASSDMLNTLLDFSRIDAGVIEPQLAPFRVQSLLNKIEREFEPQADAKGLRYRSCESALVLQSDPALVELILRNLVSNAIRYTERGGLLVTCRPRGAQAVLEVWDTGIGIPLAQQQEVFREFHQLGNPQRDQRNGLGLGLAIAQGLARTLGHPLTLKSTEHQGSRFQLALPLATETLTDQVINPELGMDQLRNVRVLVLEDDEAVRHGMLQLLRDWGCQCEGAPDQDEALARVQIFMPQVLISDYRLREERTGVQAIAALRAVLGAGLPALLITGDTAPDRLREALASGTTLLHKPLTPRQLYRALVSELQL
ncbi:hybrid sensor histidine kinase/response regulator [Rhodoferax sp.]|uniref:ATP-binding response regulator n=1 Tax=Rhodoferax sp. TaxID=50421 RepID=UPI00262C20F1|nr:hybrid sensor histidine kinase/response regulator [Rhodoferax sp.]MDD5480011.1 hybrid sensor histidine kinase/response regulator [Rhodoferax sp.]